MMAVWQWGMGGGLWERGLGWYAVASGRACMTGRFMRVSETDNTPALHAGGLGSIPRPATSHIPSLGGTARRMLGDYSGQALVP